MSGIVREEIIGDCRLILGDCQEALPSIDMHAIATDPPFGIGFAAQPTKWQRLAGQNPESWDDNAPDVRFVLDHAGAATVAIWGGNYFPLPASRSWLAWVKPDAPPSMGNAELCWTNLDKCAKYIRHSIAATNAERVGHPTQKPLAVMAFTLDYIDASGVVCDPFMGSGTTGVACVKRGCSFVGIERDERYFDMAVARIEQAYADQALFAGVSK